MARIKTGMQRTLVDFHSFSRHGLQTRQNFERLAPNADTIVDRYQFY